jgi:hypothetical protein
MTKEPPFPRQKPFLPRCFKRSGQRAPQAASGRLTRSLPMLRQNWPRPLNPSHFKRFRLQQQVLNKRRRMYCHVGCRILLPQFLKRMLSSQKPVKNQRQVHGLSFSKQLVSRSIGGMQKSSCQKTIYGLSMNFPIFRKAIAQQTQLPGHRHSIDAARDEQAAFCSGGQHLDQFCDRDDRVIVVFHEGFPVKLKDLQVGSLPIHSIGMAKPITLSGRAA